MSWPLLGVNRGMKMITLSVFVSVSAHAQDAPYYPRDTKANQDLGGMNQNYSDLSARNRDKAITSKTPEFCQSGQTLTGAYYSRSGATVGGICTAVGAASIVNSSSTFTGTNTHTGPEIFNSTVNLNGFVSGIYNMVCSSATGTQSLPNNVTGEWRGVTGSTATLTIQNSSRVRLIGNVTVDPSAGGNNVSLLFMQGGTPLGVEGGVGTGSETCFINLGAGKSSSCAGSWTTAALASGTYSFSMMVALTGGTGTITPSEMPWQLCAEEIR